MHNMNNPDWKENNDHQQRMLGEREKDSTQDIKPKAND